MEGGALLTRKDVFPYPPVGGGGADATLKIIDEHFDVLKFCYEIDDSPFTVIDELVYFLHF